MANNSSLLHEMMEVEDTVEVDEGTAISAEEKGTLRADVSFNGIVYKIVAEDVALVPSLCTNLLSFSALCQKGLAVMFSKDKIDPSQGAV